VDVLRFVFNLAVVVGYYAVALFLGSWLMALAPVGLALILTFVAVIRARFDEG
jgi:hypothetical protein